MYRRPTTTGMNKETGKRVQKGDGVHESEYYSLFCEKIKERH